MAGSYIRLRKRKPNGRRPAIRVVSRGTVRQPRRLRASRRGGGEEVGAGALPASRRRTPIVEAGRPALGLDNDLDKYAQSRK